jgi:hypothetical protein
VFASLDPFEGVHNRPMSVNGYSWVEGNVANWIDPRGMSASCMSNQVCEHLTIYEALSLGLNCSESENNMGQGYWGRHVYRMQVVPNPQGICPHGYVNVNGNCAPGVIREPICQSNNLLQARAIADSTLQTGDTSLDWWLTQIKAQCLLETNDSSLEKLAKLSDFVAQAYSNNPVGYMNLMSEVVIGTSAGATAALRSIQAGGCAGWGRETADCPDNNLFLTDSGFHQDFKDDRNQVYHFWGGVASVALMQNIFDAMITLPLNFFGFQVLHEGVQGILCNLNIGEPFGESGASWPDYALTNVAIHMGTRFALGTIRPTEVGTWIRNNVGEGGPGRFGEFEGLRDLIPLPGGFNATCG